ncbi:MAG: ABC-2 type transport system ATP-binding protein [Planctomycetota bacterium]|jgi:ABC-2 type transport system ATP-binding protein
MNPAFEFQSVSKSFSGESALVDVSLSVPEGSVVGLIGRNGCGKTTLLRHIVGLYLPTSGQCETLGCPVQKLGEIELSQIGSVHQESRFLVWMRVEDHLRYVASFYKTWDREREERLLKELDLDPLARVGALSPGNQQKLAIILAVCHHPKLLLLDEPMAAMDPIAREQMFEFLMDLLREDGNTTVISSHALRDIERIVDRVVCLEGGRLVEDTSLDDLHERYSEWVVTSKEGGLPRQYREDFVLAQRGDGYQQQLIVTASAQDVDEFSSRHAVSITAQAVNLERIFPLLVGKAK